MKKYVFILFTAGCLAAHAQNSNLVFKHITRASGLPVDEVTCLAQDSTGFIWIGSKEGLFRFDGFNYKNFYHTPGNIQTIPNNYISKLFVDTQGLLWIGTNAGVALMKNNGQILTTINSETQSLFSKNSNAIFDIQEDKNTTWISTGDGLFSLTKKNNQVTNIKKHDFQKDFSYSTNVFGVFNIDDKNRLWICTLHGLVIYDPGKKELFHTLNNPDSLSILDEKNAFRNIWIDKENRTVRYATWEPAVRLYDIDENKITTIYSGKSAKRPDYSTLTSSFLKDDHGTLWISSGKGIQTFNYTTEQIISHESDNSYSLLSNSIISLMQDKEGSIWAATSEGISITRPYLQSLVNLSYNSVNEFPFAKWAVNTIIPVSFNLFLIGTYAGDGLYSTDASFNVQEHYSFGTNKYDWIWKYSRHADKIYISAQGGNLLYDIKTQQLKKLTEPPFDTFHPIFTFATAKDSTIWMSRYYNDFMHYNPVTKNFKKYSLQQLGEEPSILQLSMDNEKNLWLLSSTAGIFKFDVNKEKITERLSANKNGLLETHILFLKDIGEELLIGYRSKGISLYHKQKKTYRHFSRSDGLVSNSVKDALQTDKETVWIATGNGLSRFDLSTNTFTNYSYYDGILQNDFQCITQLPDGRLAAGNSKGLVHFSPSEINTQLELSAPIITAINVYGEELAVDSFSAKYPLHIPSNKNYFSFEYISLQYQNNLQIEYAYMLDGFNKDWIMSGTRRFASYSNVTGGNYKLRIKARLPGGEWVESKFILPVIVHTAFYKKVWFYIVLAILLAAIIYSIFRYRLSQVIRLEKIRHTISSDLHDEVGATLSSISIFSEMAKQVVPDNSKAEGFLKKIGDRSRDSIDKMSDIIWSINPENDSIEQMLIRMKNFVNETVEGKDIAVHWEESEMISKLRLGMPQRKNLYLLFKEVIINAVKYADAKNISVQLAAQNKMLYLTIKDDGKGFSFELIKPGNGIKNIKHRAVLLNGSAEIESSPDNGTTVRVAFKL